MGALTRDAAVSRVRKAVSAQAADEAQIVLFVEETLDEFADLTSLLVAPYTFPLQAGVDTYSLTPMLRLRTVRVLSVTGDRAQSLVELDDLTEFAELRAMSTDRGVPTRYAVLGMETLRVYPMPDAAHTILGEAVMRVTLPATGATVLPVPQEYHPSIVAGAIAAFMQWDAQPQEMWVPFRQQFDAAVDRCKRAQKRVHGIGRKAARPSSSLRNDGGYPVNLADG